MAQFAAKLRDLRASALARAASATAEIKDLTIESVAQNPKWPCGVTTIYAALSGARLPSEQTLRAMVEAWDPHGSDGYMAWWRERDRAQTRAITRKADASKVAERPVATTQAAEKAIDPLALAVLRNLLREAMARRRLTLNQLVMRSSLGRTTVSQALSANNDRIPSAPTVAALAQALHLDVRELLKLREQALIPPTVGT